MFFETMVWLPIAIFIVIRMTYRLGGQVSNNFLVESLSTDSFSIDVMGGFLSFFLVLFVNQTNTRYFDMYKLSRTCSGRVQDIAGYASARLPQGAAHRLVRYMNAAHLAGYVGLRGPYKKQNFFYHYNDTYGLIQPHEMRKFDGIDLDAGSDIFKELITWCQKEVAAAQRNGHIDSIEASTMQLKVLDLRAHMDGIVDTCFQPPHFFYIVPSPLCRGHGLLGGMGRHSLDHGTSQRVARRLAIHFWYVDAKH